MTTPQNILIVCSTFYPANSPRSFRATELAKGFSKAGHNVTVLTPKNIEIHQDFENDYNITIKDLGQPKWLEIKITKKKVLGLIQRGFRRFFNMFFSYPELQFMFMVNKAVKKESNFDLLVSIAVPYPIHWGVALRRSYKNKIANVWVADCGDPFMGQENDSFKNPFYFKYVEKWFMRKADFISIPTKGSIDGYYPEFHSKIRIIPQGFNFDEVKLPDGRIKNEISTFGYAGMFIPGRRDPRELLDFLCELNIDFRFHIYSNNSDIAKPFVEKSNNRIVLHSFIPRLELLQKLAVMDFVINFENVGTKQTPSKLIDYAIIKKPILSIKTGNLDKDIVLEFLSSNYSNRYIIENPDKYKIQSVCREFINLIDVNKF